MTKWTGADSEWQIDVEHSSWRFTSVGSLVVSTSANNVGGRGRPPHMRLPGTAKCGRGHVSEISDHGTWVRLKGSFAKRWRALMRGRAKERAVAVAPDGRGAAGCVRGGSGKT